MLAKGLDASFDPPNFRTAHRQGYRFIVRYLCPTPSPKVIDPGEVQRIHAAKLGLILVWEKDKSESLRGRIGGLAAGRKALDLARDWIKYPKGSVIFFAVGDFDAQPDQFPVITAYLDGVREAFGGYYKIGAYGGAGLLRHLKAKRKAAFLWQACAPTGWYQNGSRMADAHFHQTTIDVKRAGGTVDIDEQNLPAPIWYPAAAGPAKPAAPPMAAPKSGTTSAAAPKTARVPADAGPSKKGDVIMTVEKLHFGSAGRLRGEASISHNSPWPCPNGQQGMQVPHGVLGVIMHTMVGNLPGTESVFNDPKFQASAHFGIDQSGHIHQFGPVNGWVAWAQADGNMHYYSIEFADNGNPNAPLTERQLTAGAQVVEALAEHGVFPLQEANRPGQEGLGVHHMGGAAWGGHTCPDLPPHHVRSRQRAEMLARARAIRSGKQPAAPEHHAPATHHGDRTSDGKTSLHDLSQLPQVSSNPATMLRRTAEASPKGEYEPDLAGYLDDVFNGDTADMGTGLNWFYRQKSDDDWVTHSWLTDPSSQPEDPQPLAKLAQHLGTGPQDMLRLSAELAPDKVFPRMVALYINGVFARSNAKVPVGVKLYF